MCPHHEYGHIEELTENGKRVPHYLFPDADLSETPYMCCLLHHYMDIAGVRYSLMKAIMFAKDGRLLSRNIALLANRLSAFPGMPSHYEIVRQLWQSRFASEEYRAMIDRGER